MMKELLLPVSMETLPEKEATGFVSMATVHLALKHAKCVPGGTSIGM